MTDSGRELEGDAALMREILRTAATEREVDFLAARALGGGAAAARPPLPLLREGFAFLAGLAVRARKRGTPFEATWAVLARVKRLDELTDPAARAFWDRVRRGMRDLADPAWGPEDA